MDDAGSNPVAGTESYNAYMRNYLKKRYEDRSSHFKAILGGACSWCSSVENLQFDHIDRSTKLFEVRYLLYKRRIDDPDLLAEIEKCQLLCFDCHTRKTASEVGVEHGGGVSGKRNCKCSPCKQKKAEYVRDRGYNSNRCRKKNCSCDKKHYS